MILNVNSGCDINVGFDSINFNYVYDKCKHDWNNSENDVDNGGGGDDYDCGILYLLKRFSRVAQSKLFYPYHPDNVASTAHKITIYFPDKALYPYGLGRPDL